MHAAGVVADHAAERAPAVRARIRAESQTLFDGLVLQVIEHDAWLHPRASRRSVDAEHSMQMLRRVDDDGDVAGLTSDARARAACHNRRPMLLAHLHRRDDIVDGPRNDDADGHLTVVRRVRRIQRSIDGCEANLAFYCGPKVTLKRVSVDCRVASGTRMKMGDGHASAPRTARRPLA